METVTRHLAYNIVLANGVLCKKDVKKLTELERKVLFYPNPFSYGTIKESTSDETISTYYVTPVVYLVPCADYLKKVKK